MDRSGKESQLPQKDRAEQQWEFCQLRLVASAMVKDQGMRHTLDVFYLGAEGVQAQSLSRIGHPGDEGQVWSYNPFQTALGMLGAAGWEMVAVQHGVIAPTIPSHAGDLRMDNAIAYLKRPVIAGRGIAEPTLRLP